MEIQRSGQGSIEMTSFTETAAAKKPVAEQGGTPIRLGSTSKPLSVWNKLSFGKKLAIGLAVLVCAVAVTAAILASHGALAPVLAAAGPFLAKAGAAALAVGGAAVGAATGSTAGALSALGGAAFIGMLMCSSDDTKKRVR